MIIQGATVSFKAELLRGEHDFDSDTFNIALYSETADIGPSTTSYTATGEVSGTGYVAGGKALTVGPVTFGSNSSWLPMVDISWPGASFTAAGAMIYNASNSNKSVMVISFGQPRVFDSTTNSVNFPVDGPTTSLIRVY
jgi:hypothetical protein